MPEPKKYVVVLAHADGWGALSANKVVKHLHDHYRDVGVYLVISTATKKAIKDEAGRVIRREIVTKLEDLKPVRELKETNLKAYFDKIDAMDVQQPAELLTFNQLAGRCCADGIAHFTTCGGPRGGEEVAKVVAELEKKHDGVGPEVLLSVDTMAILPKELLEKYQCFSTHPGPLDSIKIEGMQGTLRSLVNQVLYDPHGEPIPADFGIGFMSFGEAYVKGTLFLQHPELDKGPPIREALTRVLHGMSAYEVRDGLYDALTDEMLAGLPILLDKEQRAALVEWATKNKAEMDARPHQRIPELEPDQFATWQGGAVAYAGGSGPHGMELIQNQIVDPLYFRNQMRRFFPGSDEAFKQAFNEIYAPTIGRVIAQQKDRLTDPWAAFFSGDPGVVIRRHDPQTGEVLEEFKNNPPDPGRH